MAIGSDERTHVTDAVVDHLRGVGIDVELHGPLNDRPMDWVDVGREVGERVASGACQQASGEGRAPLERRQRTGNEPSVNTRSGSEGDRRCLARNRTRRVGARDDRQSRRSPPCHRLEGSEN
jgi:hypothetical protein